MKPSPSSRGAPSSGPRLTIDHAWYGLDGFLFPEVTEEVRRLVVNNHLTIKASHETLGIPDPDIPTNLLRRLDIDWSIDGVKQQKMFFPQNTCAMLPPGTHADWWSAGGDM